MRGVTFKYLKKQNIEKFPKDKIYNDYIIDNISTKQLLRLYNISKVQFYYLLDYYNIHKEIDRFNYLLNVISREDIIFKYVDLKSKSKTFEYFLSTYNNLTNTEFNHLINYYGIGFWNIYKKSITDHKLEISKKFLNGIEFQDKYNPPTNCYGYIYLTVNLKNGKLYIGQKKSQTYCFRYHGSGTAITDAIKKYGKENFDTEVLEWCYSKEEMNNKEIYWINYYNAVEDPNFYNISKGGECGNSGVIFNEQTLIKLRKPIQNLETGEMYNSMSEVSLKYTKTSLDGTFGVAAKSTEKGKSKLHYGYHWAYIKNNKPYTEEERKNILINLKYYHKEGHKIQCLETGKIFATITEAANFVGLKEGDLSSAASATKNNMNKFHGGYHWILVENSPYSLEECDSILKNLPINFHYSYIQCLENGKVFKNKNEVASLFNITTASALSKCLEATLNNISKLYKDLHWIYLYNNYKPYNEIERNQLLEGLK